MKKIAVLLTVHNRIEKTLKCIDALLESIGKTPKVHADIYLTDDGSSDGTTKVLKEKPFPDNVELHILQGSGNLFWCGGMNNSWSAAINNGSYDGYLWLNNDTYVFPDMLTELLAVNAYCLDNKHKRGIYVGSTKSSATGRFTYGGFDFKNRWILKDLFVIPDGEYHDCQCAHGNVLYVPHEVVEQMGMLYPGYWHSGADHDYTYSAYKSGIPIIVMRKYVGLCENDHGNDGYAEFLRMPLRERFSYLYSPTGFNLHNTLLFQKRCFPYRYPFVYVAGILKALLPNIYLKVYRKYRR